MTYEVCKGSLRVPTGHTGLCKIRTPVAVEVVLNDLHEEFTDISTVKLNRGYSRDHKRRRNSQFQLNECHALHSYERVKNSMDQGTSYDRCPLFESCYRTYLCLDSDR